jgi:hypothetical protein
MKIAIFHNLPEGGAIKALEGVVTTIKHRYSKDLRIDLYTIGDRQVYKSRHINVERIASSHSHVQLKTPCDLLRKIHFLIFDLDKYHKKVANDINSKDYDICFVCHDHLTKSPHILRHIKHKKVYILHEPQREYYENIFLHINSFRNLLGIILMYPIKIIDRINATFADIILVNSQYSKEVIKKVYKMDSMILYPTLHINTQKRSINNTRQPSIVLLGSLNKTKGIIQVLEYFRHYIRTETDIIIISNSSKNDIDQSLGKYKASHVRILHNPSDKKIKYIFTQARLAIFNYRFEPFGLSAIEAQLYGCEVIGRKEAGLQETIVDKQRQFLRLQDMEKQIRDVFSNPTNNNTIHRRVLVRIVKMNRHNYRVLDKLML